MTTNQKSPKSKDWFLETSVPRNLFFGHSLQREDVKKHLGRAKCWSSHYVRMEYKRSVVKTLIDLYHVALEEDSPSDALTFFSQSYKIREAKTVLSAVGELAKEPDILNNKEKFLIKLQMLIASAERHLDNVVEFVKNETDCPLAKASTSKNYKTFLDEISCRTNCDVDSLWHKSKPQIRQLTSVEARADHGSNDGFTKHLQVVESAIDNPSAPKSILNCKKVGDFVIALEMPRGLRMLTTDRAFEAICAVLKKDFVRLRSLSELRRERDAQLST